MKQSKSLIISTLLGNLFEHYDTALFGFLSPFLAPLIFPDQDPLMALILTYAIIPLGMLARPFGSLLFGRIGDCYGRKQALFFSLAGMSVVSGAMAFCPLYAEAGIFSPLLFGLGRILQNILAAGEIMGGSIFLLENAPKKHHDLISSFYGASTVGGILLASGAVSLLSYYGWIDSGWRLLYLAGCVTGALASVIRNFADITPATTKHFSETYTYLRSIFWLYRKPLFFISVASGFSYACYSIALVLMNGFIPLVSSVTKEEVISINTALLMLDICTLPLFGWIASKISREKLMLGAASAAAVSAIPLFMLLQEGSFALIVFARISFVLIGVAFSAPLHAWAQTLVPKEQRYILLSLGYALGSQLIGGPTTALSLWIFKQTAIISSAAWYWTGLAVLSTFAVALQMKRSLVKETV